MKQQRKIFICEWCGESFKDWNRYAAHLMMRLDKNSKERRVEQK